jgi:hypothetical protein
MSSPQFNNAPRRWPVAIKPSRTGVIAVKQLSVIATNASQALLRPLKDQPADLIARNPLENERESISLLRQCGLQPTFERAGGGMTPKSVALNPSEATDWQQCGEIIAELVAPAPEEKILEWLGMMSVLVAKQGQDQSVSKLELVAYARKLRGWPADVVRTVLDRYPDHHKWWPEWRDLRVMLAEAGRERMMLAESFNRWIAAPDFMAKREGIAQLEGQTRRLAAPVPQAQRITTAARDVPQEYSADERQRLMDAHKARLRSADTKGQADG